MPGKEKKIRETKEIMEDMTLTEEEWRQEMTESYKSQYMTQPHIIKMNEQLNEIRENIQASVQSKDSDPKLVKELAEELERVSQKMAEEEKKIDETVADLVREDREKRTAFVKPPIIVTEEQQKELEDALSEDEPKQEEAKKVKEDAVPQKKEEPGQEEVPAKTKEELQEDIEKEIETLRNDADLPQADWNEKMHHAIERFYLLQYAEDFDKQDQKTQDLTGRIEKMQKDRKEGDDRKPLDDLETELGDHLTQVTKDRSKAAAQVENMYADELYKRKENKLADKQRDLRKANKTQEAADVQKERDLAGQELTKTEQYAQLLTKEQETPNPNIFESAFMKTFSGWLPETVFDVLGSGFGRSDVVKVVRVPLENNGNGTFFSSKDAIHPTGPDHLTDLFKSVEQKKEKTSEEILKADRAADLNFDEVDHEAKKRGDQMEQARHMSAPKGFTGLKMTDLKGVPHKEADLPEEEIQKEQVQQAGGKPRKFTGTSQIVKASEIKLNVPHAEIPEQKEEIQNTAEETPPTKKEETKQETKEPEMPKAEENGMSSNVMKAFKLVELFRRMKEHDSATHINSGRYDTMMSSMGKLDRIMGDGFGDDFGTLMRDFGNISSFQDLCKKGGPLDLAVGQALSEIEKKCDAYVQEKTNHLTKTHMGSGLGNARIKDAMDALSICNPDRAKELGKHISIDVVDGKASKRINYNELNEMEREQEMKEMDEAKRARKQIVGEKKKEKELLERDPVMSKEEKSKQQGLHL